MAKIMDSGLKAFKIRKRDRVMGAGGATRSIGRSTGAGGVGRRTLALGTTWGGSAIPEAIDERAFGFIRKGVPSFLVRVSESMPSAVGQDRP